MLRNVLKSPTVEKGADYARLVGQHEENRSERKPKHGGTDQIIDPRRRTLGRFTLTHEERPTGERRKQMKTSE